MCNHWHRKEKVCGNAIRETTNQKGQGKSEVGDSFVLQNYVQKQDHDEKTATEPLFTG